MQVTSIGAAFGPLLGFKLRFVNIVADTVKQRRSQLCRYHLETEVKAFLVHPVRQAYSGAYTRRVNQTKNTKVDGL